MGTGERILYYLEQNRMQQKELAEKINMDTAVLNRIIKNRRPARSEELSNIANVLGTSMDELEGRVPGSDSSISPLEGFDKTPQAQSALGGTSKRAFQPGASFWHTSDARGKSAMAVAASPASILMRAEQDLTPEKRKILEDMAKVLLGDDTKEQRQ